MTEMFTRIRYLFILLGVTAIFSAPGFSQSNDLRTMPDDFKTDGCTFFPDGNYRDCCVEHDKAYYFGGSLEGRRAADNQLYECVKSKQGKHKKLIARVMWMGVRVGAVSFLPTPFRWGFGNKYPRRKPSIDGSQKSEKPIDH